MIDTLSTWLALREPADVAARSLPITRALVGALGHERPLRILELGTGTGSNVRYLIEHLGPRQDWLLVDRDPTLLAEIPARMAVWATSRGYHTEVVNDRIILHGAALECQIERRAMDLGRLDDPRLFANRHLVTASALLDLVSDRWLRTLAERCRDAGAAVLFTLTYDGRSRPSPGEPEDDRVRDLLNRHQKNDKGFAPAAGPDAVECAARAFAQVGYHVERASSDWVLSPDVPQLQRQLMEGWAHAAIEIAPEEAAWVREWLMRRVAHVDAGRSHVVVCHEDIAAWPARAASQR
jgi:hypothetical protein